MRIQLFAITLVLVSSLSAEAKAPYADLNYTQALQKAKVEKKVVFIDFSTSWCWSCKEMEENTFADAQVTALFKKMIVIRLDGDKKENEEIKKKWKIKGYPTCIILKSDEIFIERFGGYKTVGEVLPILRAALQGEGLLQYKLKQYAAQWKEKPGDVQIGLHLSKAYTNADQEDRAKDILSELLEKDSEGKNPDLDEARVDLAKLLNYSNQEDHNITLKIRNMAQAVINRQPESKYLASAIDAYLKTFAYWCAKNIKEYREGFQTTKDFLSRFPDDETTNCYYIDWCTELRLEMDKALVQAKHLVELSKSKSKQDQANALSNLAYLYFKMDMKDEALQTARQGLGLNPDKKDKYAVQALYKYEYAMEHMKEAAKEKGREK